ncbi:MAG: TolC family protein [Candidatus Obscuribacterales bacterium]|nr:TolC family protein [Candidatus Obscuribacterales bacterium]
METLLLGMINLVLGLSAAQTAVLLNGPEVSSGSQVSDSCRAVAASQEAADCKVAMGDPSSPPDPEGEYRDSEARPRSGSLKLTRGPQGEAFVTESQTSNFRVPSIDLDNSPEKIGAVRISQQSPTDDPPKLGEPGSLPASAPTLRPAIRSSGELDGDKKAPLSGSDKSANTETGEGIYKNTPISDPELGKSQSVKSDSAQSSGGASRDSKSSVHDHGEEFPADIDNISPAATTADQSPEMPDVSATIRFDERGKEDVLVKGTVSIFDALDQALVKSPRAAALRSLLPVTQSELARATEQEGPDYTYDLGVRAEQTRRTGVNFHWEPPWKLVFRLLAAKRLVEQAKQDLLSQLWSLRAEVRLAYTEVVVAQETLETLNSLYDLAHRLMVVSEKRFQAGDVPELDMLKARLAESQYDVERRVGLRRVIRAKQQLNVIMGRKPEAAISVPRLPAFLKTSEMATAAEASNLLLPNFDKPFATLPFYVEMAMKHRYELKSLDRQVAVNRAQLRNAYGNIAPSPQFWMGSSVTGNPPTGPKLSAYYFGVNVPSNITDFQQGDIAKFKAVARQLKYQTEALKNVITSEVSSAYNNVLAARQKLRIYQEHVLADSYEVARLARRSYEVGQSDITSTIQAQQNNVQIRTQYLEAIQLYQQSFTELERSCGMPLLYADE